MPAGRPTDYSQDMADKICEEVASGSNLNRICAADDMPDRTTVYRWLNNNKEFHNNYARAKEDRADYRFDKTDQVISDMRSGTIDANQARVEIDLIKWQCGKEKSKQYGDSTQLRHADADGNNLVKDALDFVSGKTAGLPTKAEKEN